MEIETKKLKKPDIRYLDEIRELLFDQKWAKTVPNFKVYYVWRGVRKKGNLRYDITIIPPKMLGKEFPKTSGHKHLKRFQELINVLEGRAYYFRQKGKGNKIDEVKVIKAKKGDWLIIPRGYDHLTINPAKKRLVMANWICNKCENDYSFFEKYQGACYYYTKSGWIKNKNYKKIPKIRFENALKSMPENLDFLRG